MFNEIFDILIKDLYEGAEGVYSPAAKRTHITSNEEEYKIEVLVPGLMKEDLKITLNDAVLNVSFTKNEKDTRPFVNSFMRKFGLAHDSLENKISSKLENGILTITIPRDKKKERTIKID